MFYRKAQNEIRVECMYKVIGSFKYYYRSWCQETKLLLFETLPQYTTLGHRKHFFINFLEMIFPVRKFKSTIFQI